MELEQLNLEYGVRVLDIGPQGPAANAGVLPGDILIGLNGSPIYSVARLMWILRNVSPGDTVEMELSRRGDRLTIASRLSAPQGMPPRAVRPDYAPPPTRTYLGVHLQEMTEADLQSAWNQPENWKGTRARRPGTRETLCCCLVKKRM